MKNLLTACLPALALFALGGCAGTSALTSSEDDGVYYSSKDHTTAIVSAPTAPAITEEAANPDYNGRASSPAARQGSGSDQYYDNTYTYMRGAPSYTPPLGYYMPYSPYTSLGYGGGAYGFSPYSYGGFSDPFYGSFGSPYGYGYGSGLSISFGFGRSFGYGGGFGSPFGYGYGSPFGYGGYGGYGGFYDPYFYGSSFYGGYYGRSGYYGNSYGGGYGGNYGGGNYSYGNGYTGADNGNGRTSGHRTDRSSEGRYNGGSGGVATPGTTGTAAGGGRVRSERIMSAPGTPSQAMPAGDFEGRRTRNEGVTETPGKRPVGADGIFNQAQAADARQPRYRNMDPMAGSNNSQPNIGTAPDQGQLTRDGNRGRYAEAAPQSGQAQPQMQPNATPQGDKRNRGGFFQNVFSQPNNPNAGQTAQPQQRSEDQSQQRQQRSYEQPQRSYEQPQRSYSQPSYGGSNGGGNRGGGGGGGGGNSRGRGN